MKQLYTRTKKTINIFQLSLQRHFGVFTTLILSAVIVLCISIGVSEYLHTEETRKYYYNEQSDRVDRAIAESFNYVTYYAKFLGEKIIEHGSADPTFIAELLHTKSQVDPLEAHLYSWTLFDWINTDNKMVVSTKLGVLKKPIDMSHRTYMQYTKKQPWKLHMSEAAVGIPSGQWIIPTGIGVRDEKSKKFYGTIGTGFSIERLTQKIEQMLDEEVVFVLLDKDLKFITMSSSVNFKPKPDYFVKAVRKYLNSPEAEGDAGLFSKPIAFENIKLSYYRRSTRYPMYILVGYNSLITDRDLFRNISPRIVEISLMGLFAFALLLIARKSERESHAAIQAANNTLEQRVTERTLALEKALETKKEFVRNMSHEIQITVGGICDSADLFLSQELDLDEATKVQMVESIGESGNRLRKLVRNLLDLNKMDARTAVFKLEPNDLTALAQSIIESCKATATKKQLHLSFEKPQGFSTITAFDPMQIEQVIENLVTNAMKFTPSGGSITASILPKVIHYPDRSTCPGLMFSLRDEGVGVPEHEIEAIFHTFFQSTRTRTGAGGTGLGLSICYEIIKTHNGKIWCVNNKEGKGSTFSFVLPLTTESRTIEYDLSPQKEENTP